MIEIRIPKEIREYKEKIFIGLTLKQVIAIGVMAVVNIPLFMVLNPLFGMQIASLVIMLVAAPIGAWGFVKIGGLDAEEFIKLFFINTFILPLNRKYETENVYEQIADMIREKDYQDIKDDFEKVRIAEQKSLQADEVKLRRKMGSKAKTVDSKQLAVDSEKKVEKKKKGEETNNEQVATNNDRKLAPQVVEEEVVGEQVVGDAVPGVPAEQPIIEEPTPEVVGADIIRPQEEIAIEEKTEKKTAFGLKSKEESEE